jgi:cytochrome c-type biogenesis protein CcmH/NrfG
LQLGQDQIDDAITSYTQAVELDPDNEAIQAKLAEAQQRAEDEEVQMVRACKISTSAVSALPI